MCSKTARIEVCGGECGIGDLNGALGLDRNVGICLGDLRNSKSVVEGNRVANLQDGVSFGLAHRPPSRKWVLANRSATEYRW